MLFLLVAVVLVLVVAALATIGPLALGSRSPQERILGRTGVSVARAVAGGIAGLLLVAVLGAMVGIRQGPGEDEPPPAPPDPDPSAATVPTVPEATSLAPVTSPVLGPLVRLRREGPLALDAFAGVAPVVDRLDADTVLQVHVEGFEPFVRGRAEQCVGVERRQCGNPLDVQFDGHGRASFQYLVVDDFASGAGAGRCGAEARPCFVTVAADGVAGRAEIQTAFGGALPPPGVLHVSPSAGLADGQAVAVELEGLPPAAVVEVGLCAPPSTSGTARCGAPGPTTPVSVGADGTATASLTIPSGPVGRDGLRCGHGQACAVAVVAGPASARAPVVPIDFAAPPGARVGQLRLGAGLAVAVVLLGIAAWLIRRTDWSPIGEEAAPEIDDAEYADLDAIVADLPPQPDLDELLRSHR